MKMDLNFILILEVIPPGFISSPGLGLQELCLFLVKRILDPDPKSWPHSWL